MKTTHMSREFVWERFSEKDNEKIGAEAGQRDFVYNGSLGGALGFPPSGGPAHHPCA
jgi:hypothetical protein